METAILGLNLLAQQLKLDSSKKVHCNLDVHNMFQISIDGLNFNWKMGEIANKHCNEQMLPLC